jgi:prolyl oligopeptidase
MSRSHRNVFLVAGLAIAFALPAAAQRTYPTSRVDTVIDRYGSVEIADLYRWLEDQESPETRAWIEAQNAFREELMADLPGRNAVSARLAELLMVDQQSAPAVRGNRYFFSKRAAGQDLFVIYMREGPDGEDIPLIDPHIMATDVPLSVGINGVSEDGSLLSYGIRQGGQDETMVRFFDVDRRRVLPDYLEKSRYFGVAMTPDGTGIYFTRYDEGGPRVFYRAMGAPAEEDRIVFGEDLGPEKIAFAQLSDDGTRMLITVAEGTSGGNDLYFKNLAADAPAVAMVEGTGQNYLVTFAGEHIVIQTDWDAPNGRVLLTSMDAPKRADWQEIIPEQEHVVQGFSLAGGYLWVNYLENVVGRVRGFDLDGNHFRDIELPALGSISGLGGEFDRDEAFFSFTSYHIPATTYRYSVARDERSVWSRQDLPFESDAFELKQVWYNSKDGTRIPMFVAHRKDLELDGTNPTYLTGYGGFNVSLTPGFSAQHAVWMEGGGVLAVPNMRGGGEFGEAWHKAGMFDRRFHRRRRMVDRQRVHDTGEAGHRRGE